MQTQDTETGAVTSRWSWVIWGVQMCIRDRSYQVPMASGPEQEQESDGQQAGDQRPRRQRLLHLDKPNAEGEGNDLSLIHIFIQ